MTVYELLPGLLFVNSTSVDILERSVELDNIGQGGHFSHSKNPVGESSVFCCQTFFSFFQRPRSKTPCEAEPVSRRAVSLDGHRQVLGTLANVTLEEVSRAWRLCGVQPELLGMFWKDLNGECLIFERPKDLWKPPVGGRSSRNTDKTLLQCEEKSTNLRRARRPVAGSRAAPQAGPGSKCRAPPLRLRCCACLQDRSSSGHCDRKMCRICSMTVPPIALQLLNMIPQVGSSTGRLLIG